VPENKPERQGVEIIYVPLGYMFFNRTFVTTDGVRFVPKNPCTGKDVVVSQFWPFDSRAGLCLGGLTQEVCDTFRAEFLTLFPIDPSDMHVL
jgi:hypothetical protein